LSPRLVGWIAAALAVAVALELVVPPLVFLAVPITVVARILVARRGKRDVAEMLVSWVAALPGHRSRFDDDQPEWGAVRAELASISVARERRRFALGVTAAILGTPRRRRSGVFAVGVAAVFAAGLLGFSRATVGADGVGTMSVLLPPILLFRDRLSLCPIDWVAGLRGRDGRPDRVHDPGGDGRGPRRRGGALVRRGPCLRL
jgi:hypothetical protein